MVVKEAEANKVEMVLMEMMLLLMIPPKKNSILKI
jgi:hypothetical protein